METEFDPFAHRQKNEFNRMTWWDYENEQKD